MNFIELRDKPWKIVVPNMMDEYYKNLTFINIRVGTKRSIED